MALSRHDVVHIAHLARLAVSDEEVEEYAGKLSRILALADELKKADTSGVPPMAHPLAMSQRLRDDEISEENHREHIQENAPQAEAGLYLVPRVIE